jgi:hypothetical protein
MLPYETGDDNGLPPNAPGAGRWTVHTYDPAVDGAGFPGIAGRHTVLHLERNDGTSLQFPLVNGTCGLLALDLAQSEGYTENP